ncbi:MAG: sigma-54-dependent Fis family transcriptional regulator [Magnetococcales bacterium]|nr:sigma-54-dependent Fis family transcriptional regulator [Magnetococcales bacterium]
MSAIKSGPDLGQGRRFLTTDERVLEMLQQVRLVARSTATVLIRGESGTGKELIARYIHQMSDRKNGPFVAINCAALPDTLLESELFGHVKGAFTGAFVDRRGKFLQANGGVVFLDEISEMSFGLQAKLLRVLQERVVDPLGGRNPVPLDVRVVASTNRDLKAMVKAGGFRNDLYYRLNVFPVHIPPLRARLGDIPLLADYFCKRYAGEASRNLSFSAGAMTALKRHVWDGNVRELENTIQRAVIMAAGDSILVRDLMIDAPSSCLE